MLANVSIMCCMGCWYVNKGSAPTFKRNDLTMPTAGMRLATAVMSHSSPCSLRTRDQMFPVASINTHDKEGNINLGPDVSTLTARDSRRRCSHGNVGACCPLAEEG